MDEKIHSRLLKELPAIAEKQQVLSFSCGADSVACLIRMRYWGMRPKMFYLEFLPGLPMVENYLKYIEDKFGEPIIRLPGKHFLSFMVNGQLQKPGVGARLFEDAMESGFNVPKSSDINDVVMEAFPDHMMSLGLRVSDGIFRAKKLRERGPVEWEKNEWYPVADCFRSDIVSIIENAGVKLPVDYRLFGRSFEAIRYSVSPYIREHCPKTWAVIEEHFPLARLQCAQAALIPESRDVKSRVTSYKHLAFESEDCTL